MAELPYDVDGGQEIEIAPHRRVDDTEGPAELRTIPGLAVPVGEHRPEAAQCGRWDLASKFRNVAGEEGSDESVAPATTRGCGAGEIGERKPTAQPQPLRVADLLQPEAVQFMKCDALFLAQLFPGYTKIIVVKESGITKFEDLFAKRVTGGKNGWASEFLFRMVLSAYDMDYQKIKANGGVVNYVGTGQATQMMRVGNLDAMFITGNPPVRPKFKELTTTTDIDVIDIGEEGLDRVFAKYPFFPGCRGRLRVRGAGPHRLHHRGGARLPLKPPTTGRPRWHRSFQ